MDLIEFHNMVRSANKKILHACKTPKGTPYTNGTLTQQTYPAMPRLSWKQLVNLSVQAQSLHGSYANRSRRQLRTMGDGRFAVYA